ncbi:MAG: acetyl-CoA synthase subunit gamma [Actinobacteria bacterium]|nr:MAG: acetyl-CoA synthase subunit gamma [Actinomycetota bacterium]
MSDCCGPSCCGGGAPYVDDYDYPAQPYVDGEVFTFAGAVPRLRTELSRADRSGALRVRLNVGRNDYRVRPGLYAVGEPDDASPVLVTGNYKLSVDAVRSQLGGYNAWLLVADSRGVNVWCAAGKGVFSTEEIVRSVQVARLDQVVSHQKLVLPQLGATGVAAHEVRERTGFSVVWGPVRADDLPTFLDAGMKATAEMRRVRFDTRDRAKLVGVELSVLWRPRTLAWVAAGVAALLALTFVSAPLAAAGAIAAIAAALAVVAGAGLMPLLMPWLPGRTFSLKGAEIGAVLVGAFVIALAGGIPGAGGWGLIIAGAALASFVAMNFTGSSTFTSPSGVEWEMRRAIPLQIAGAVVGVALMVIGLVA